MNRRLRRSKLDLAWSTLVVLALAGVALAYREQSIRLGIAVAMGIAWIKAVLILELYMDVRLAPIVVRALLMIWAACCAGMIVILH
ncbi:cytochrome C oxidase subunit IV family protein [Sphingomonas oryzagri]